MSIFCVRCMDVVFPDYSQVSGLSGDRWGSRMPAIRTASSRTMSLLRGQQVRKFGVTRGSKAFDVHANSYRVDADVVACFEHRRRYFRTNSQTTELLSQELNFSHIAAARL